MQIKIAALDCSPCVCGLQSRADFPEVVELVNRAYRGGGEAAGWTNEVGGVEGQRLNIALFRAEWNAELNALLLIHRLEPSGPLLGTVWLEPKADGVCYPGPLKVHLVWQNLSQGRALLAVAEDFFRANAGVDLSTTVVNVRDSLIARYERPGYQLSGETQTLPYEDARFCTALREDLQFIVLEKHL